MKFRLTFFLFVFALPTISFAVKDEFMFMDEFKKRKLIVVEAKEDAATVSTLKAEGKTEELEEYQAILSLNNERTKAGFANWKDTPVEFWTSEQTKNVSDEQRGGYAFLNRYKETTGKIDFMYYQVLMFEVIKDKKGNVTTEKHWVNYKVSMEGEVVSAADVLFVMEKMKVLLGLKPIFDREQLTTTLASKTLILDKESCELTEEEVKENYDHPFKFVTGEELMAAKNNQDPGMVYVKVDFYDGMANFLIVDCKTGQIMSRSTDSGLTKISWNETTGHYEDHYNKQTQKMEIRYKHEGGIGKELYVLYRPQAKLKKPILRVLNNQKQQLKYYEKLVIH